MKSEKSMRGILSDFSHFKRTMTENQHVQGVIGESSVSFQFPFSFLSASSQVPSRFLPESFQNPGDARGAR